MSGADGDAHGVWLRDADGVERQIGPAELVDLSRPGVETFVTRLLAG